ncbi:MAG: flagellar motor switch protein FliN [Treponema sp.]|jgi:flagellar motor switch protein FliN/FliY|nr:flagellar motor switch protein FliN [Treponema sp.]
MSDGALSQDEIDALLAGVDSSSLGGGPAAAPMAPSMGGGAPVDVQALQGFLASTVDAQSSNLSMMTGAPVSIRGPQVSSTSRDALLGQLPDMVTVVKADFSSGFPGEHMFLIPEATAKSIASLMNKEENIELDEMAMSVLGEVISQLVGTQITSLTDKTGNKSIASVSPEAANVAKAVAALPGGEFPVAMYQLDLGDGAPNQFWEVYGSGVAADISRALSGGAAAGPGMGGMMPNMGAPAMPNMGGGMTMPGMGGMPNMGGMMPNMGAMMPNMGMGMQGMGGQTNVQPVQFPNLMPHITQQETGNIGLIMDVFMEMTVELGRTRKLIKEILGMGEGTIIELDKLAGEPVDILVNHKLIAKGEVVVIDENFGVRVTEIVSPMERMSDMG